MINRSEIFARYKPVRENLLLILHDIQNNNPEQYISKDDIIATAKYLNISLGSVYGVVSYYSMLSLKPRTKYIIRVCISPVCAMEKSDNLIDELRAILSAGSENISDDGLFTIETTECLGHCEESPGIMINDQFYGNLNREVIVKIIKQLKSAEHEN